jgi:hypothetical protein
VFVCCNDKNKILEKILVHNDYINIDLNLINSLAITNTEFQGEVTGRQRVEGAWGRRWCGPEGRRDGEVRMTAG